MTSLKIAFIQETFNPFFGGSQRRVYEISKRLLAKGFDIDVYTVALNKQWKMHEDIDGIQVHREVFAPKYLTKDGLRDISGVLAYTSKSLKYVAKNNHEIVDVNHCPLIPAQLLKFSSQFFSNKIILTIHECWDDAWKLYTNSFCKYILGRLSERTTYLGYRKIIAVSDLIKQRLERFKLFNSLIAVISNGVSLEEIRKYTKNKKEDKVIYVGQLGVRKNVHLLLKAWRSLDHDFQLEIVGRGVEYPKLLKLKESLKLENVTFKGWVSDKEKFELMSTAKVLVFPSDREGEGIVALEAMGCGTPFIAVDSSMSNLPILAEKSEAGFVTKLGPDSLANAIATLMNDTHLQNKLRANGLSYIKEYDWDNVTDKYLQFLSLRS